MLIDTCFEEKLNSGHTCDVPLTVLPGLVNHVFVRDQRKQGHRLAEARYETGSQE
jgi:hypothetical protein